MTSSSRRPLGQGPTPVPVTAPRGPRLLPAELAAAVTRDPALPDEEPDEAPPRRQLGTGIG